MKRNAQRSKWQVWLGLVVACQFAGCAVWETDVPDAVEHTSSGSKLVDQTRTEDGQPYFLPKGLIHLVVAPQGTADSNGGGTGTGAAGAATKLENHLTYKVTADVKLVPDREAGALYAHYHTNWVFADNTSISVTSDGLLSALASTAEDRSPQILSNLEDTAIDLGEFYAAGGIPKFPSVTTKSGSSNLPTMLKNGSADEGKPAQYKAALGALQKDESALLKVRQTLFDFAELKRRLALFELAYKTLRTALDEHRPRLPEFYLKRLNVEEWFDPFNPTDVARVKSLFADRTDGAMPEYSPVRLEISYAAPVRGEPCPGAGPRRDGLWFREPTQVELSLRPNERYAQHLRSQIVAKSQMTVKTVLLSQDKDTATYLSTALGTLLQKIKSSDDALKDLWLHPPAPVAQANQPAQETVSTPTPAATSTPATGSPAATPTVPPPLPPEVPKHGGKNKQSKQPPKQEGGPIMSGLPEDDEEPPPAPDEPAWSERSLRADLRYLADHEQALLSIQPALAHLPDDVGQQIAAASAQINSDRDQSYHGNLRGEVAGLGTFSFTLPDKQRPFSLNVPRSAFVVRSMTMNIQNGVLLGFSHNKPSEAEGFTTIPLTLAKKLASVPQSLFTARNNTLQGQDTDIKSRTQLISDQQAFSAAAHPAKPAAPPPPAAAAASAPVNP